MALIKWGRRCSTQVTVARGITTQRPSLRRQDHKASAVAAKGQRATRQVRQALEQLRKPPLQLNVVLAFGWSPLTERSIHRKLTRTSPPTQHWSRCSCSLQQVLATARQKLENECPQSCWSRDEVSIHLSLSKSPPIQCHTCAIHASMYPCIHPSIHPSIHACMHPCIHPSVHPCIHPSIPASIYSSMHLPTHKSMNRCNPSISPSSKPCCKPGDKPGYKCFYLSTSLNPSMIL